VENYRGAKKPYEKPQVQKDEIGTQELLKTSSPTDKLPKEPKEPK
jgi:hypothetical protein